MRAVAFCQGLWISTWLSISSHLFISKHKEGMRSVQWALEYWVKIVDIGFQLRHFCYVHRIHFMKKHSAIHNEYWQSTAVIVWFGIPCCLHCLWTCMIWYTLLLALLVNLSILFDWSSDLCSTFFHVRFLISQAEVNLGWSFEVYMVDQLMITFWPNWWSFWRSLVRLQLAF
jgi:hypothetical protein